MILLTQNLSGGSSFADLTFDFENGTSGVIIASGDTPSSGDTAFASVTENTGSGGSFKYDNGQAAHGTQSVKFSTGGTSVSCYAQWDITGSGLTVYSRYYIYIPTGTSFAARFDHWQIRDSATRIRHGISTTNQVVAINGSTVVATSTNTLPFDTWIRVEGKLVIDASAGVIEVKFFTGDSTTATETLTSTGLNTGTVECTNIRMGNPFATANLGPLYMDDFAFGIGGYFGPVASSGFSETVNDPAGLADAVALTYGKGQTDSAGVTDALALVHGKGQTDTAGLTDTIVRVLAYARTLNDNSGLTDELATQLGKLITFDDTAGLSDATSTAIGYGRIQSDTSGLTDAIVRVLDYARTFSDNAGLSDAISTVLAKFATFDDDAGLTDALASELSFLRTIDDTSLLTDEIVVTFTQTFYLFTPPSRRRRPELERPHGLWLRIGQESGISVLKFGSSYQQLEDPDPVQITASDAAYLGGRTYRVGSTERDSLVAAGYGPYIVAE